MTERCLNEATDILMPYNVVCTSVIEQTRPDVNCHADFCSTACAGTECLCMSISVASRAQLLNKIWTQKLIEVRVAVSPIVAHSPVF